MFRSSYSSKSRNNSRNNSLDKVVERKSSLLDDSDSSSNEKERKSSRKKKTVDPTSTSFKFKKFMNSRISQSKLGRMAIQHFLGSAGNHILEHLQAAANAHYGKPAKNLCNSIIHLSLKGKLLHDSRILTQKDVFHLMDPINFLMLNLYATLEESEDRVDVKDLHRSAMKLKYDLLELLGTHMTPKNKTKVANVVDMIASLEFLTALCESEKMMSQKEVIGDDLRDMLAPLLLQREEEDECKFLRCTAKEVNIICPTFRNLNYCAKHHQKKYENLLMEPTINHFFTDDKDCELFELFMTKHLPQNMLALYKGLNNYARSPTRVRGPFARAIADKYFDEKATHPVIDLPEELLAGAKTHLQDPTLTTFIPLLTICTEHVDRVFIMFCKSEEFKQYINMLSLPEYLAAGIRATVIEKMKASEQFLEEKSIEGESPERESSVGSLSNSMGESSVGSLSNSMGDTCSSLVDVDESEVLSFNDNFNKN